jgi:HYR domain/CARDB/Secretion system C-terminal sorting domain/Domain of unknown function DUF11
MNKTLNTLVCLLFLCFQFSQAALAHANTLSPVITCPNNLLQNAEFDTQLNGWENPTDAYVVTSPDGDNIATMCAVTAPGQLYQQKPALAGGLYSFTTNARNDGSSPTELYMLFLDANGQPLYTEYILFFDNSYIDYTVTSTAPAGTATIEVGFALILGPTCMFASSTCLTGPTVVNTTPCLPDLSAPTLTNCPANINIALGTSLGTVGTIPATWAQPIATDSCGAATLTSNFQSGDLFEVGSTTVNYLATDAAGNTAACSFQVNVAPAVLPCSPDITVPMISGCPFPIVTTTNTNTAIANWQAPTATDICGAVTITSTHDSGASFPVGMNMVTYTATDASGNTATCNFNVMVQGVNPCLPDTTKPFFLSCPTNLSLTTTDTAALAVWGAPSAFDQCGSTTISSTHNSGTLFPVGTTTVMYLVSDVSQNSASCSFTVFVEKITTPCSPDVTAPVLLDCPANMTVKTTTFAGVPVQWNAPLASDSCSSVSLTSNYQPGAVFGLGDKTVTYTALDGAGNTKTCSFIITVEPESPCHPDMTAPIITTCPQNQLVTTTAAIAAANWVEPTGLDSCTAITFTSNYPSGYFFPIGARTVIYTARDVAGNTAKCSFVVTVEQIQSPCFPDVTAPTLSNCPANISLTTTLGAALAQWTAPTAFDSCSVATITSNFAPGTNFSLGTKTVTYTATDASNNTARCSFTVTVTALASPCFPDKSAPVISNCPANMNRTTTATSAVVTWVAPTAFDSCSQVVLTSNYISGATFPIGTRTVIYTARDASFNTARCSFKVTVAKLVTPCSPDVTKPTIAGCPANITVTAALGATNAVVQWTKPTALDSCSSVTLVSNYQPGAIFPIGVRTVEYIAKDVAGNITRCTFTVTVVGQTSPCFPDKTAPKLTACPASITVAAAPGATTKVVTWIAPTATDSCSTATLTSTRQSGFAFPIGATNVTYMARDAAGNTASCTFKVTVTATVSPCFPDVRSPKFLACPASITVAAAPGALTASATWTAPTATDSCTAVTVTSNYQPGAIFAVGTKTVQYIARDVAGNSASCTFNVTVTSQNTPCSPDLTAPTIINCPANISVTTTTTSKIVQWVAPTAKDTCGAVTLTSTHVPGASFPVGTTIVKYTAKDAANNTRTCQFTITVTSSATLRPDLTLANLAAKDTASVDASLVFKVDLKNIGNGNAITAFSLRGYISTDTIISSNDLQTGYFNVAYMNAGSSLNQLTASGYVPAATASGKYYLIVKADAANQITESNENNNVLLKQITVVNKNVIGGKPDLRVTIHADSSKVAQLGKVIYTVTIHNDGNAAVTTAGVKIGVCGNGLFAFNQTSKLVYAVTSFVPSAGSYNFLSQIWTVSNLGAGKSATLKLPMLYLGTAELKVAAWVSSQSPTDLDSQPSASAPANCVALQDDEAIAIINAGQSLVIHNASNQTTAAVEPESYQLYPNPAQEMVYVVVPPLAETAQITVFNQVGTQMTATQKIFLAKEDNTVLQIPVTEFANGIYFIRIESEGTRAITKKLMVARPE